MCTAIYRDGILARTVDRTVEGGEHFAVARENYAGGVIRGEFGEIWIDGINRSGLTAALLNYRKDVAAECEECGEREKLHPGRLIPRLMQCCRDVRDAREFLGGVSLGEDMPVMYPHYIIGDASGACIVYESGRVIDNPWGVLANAPSLREQSEHLCAVMEKGSIVWDHTSRSRFCRASWLRMHGKDHSVSGYFALLDALAVPVGMDPRENYRTVLKTVMCAADCSYSYSHEEVRTIRRMTIGECGSYPASI